jgi:hypothetical protein
MQVSGVFQKKFSLTGVGIEDARYRQPFRIQVVADQKIGVVLIAAVFCCSTR